MVAGAKTTAAGPIKYGMVGGGQGAFIGAVHRIAARMDGHFELVAGALSSQKTRALASAKELGLDPARSYGSYEEMAKAEAAREDGIEAVAIVTPNHMHFPIAAAFLKAGIHVICDKPLTSSLADAKKLVKLADASDRLFVLTHNYTGYPMIRQAREMIAKGKLGSLRVVRAEYAQDWLSEELEKTGQKQAAWRTDPKQSGDGGSIGDIGTHAYNLACFVTGAVCESLSADLDTFGKGRKLDDNAHVNLRFEKGLKGTLWCSQVAPGNENGLTLRVYGAKGGLEWSQENPNQLWYTPLGQPKQLITRGGAGSGDAAARMTRIPPGHPEGYLEGFANIYGEAALAIRAKRRKGGKLPKGAVFPTVHDGLKGMQFIDACVKSDKKNCAWVKL